MDYAYWKQVHGHLLREGSRFAKPIGWHVSRGPSMIGLEQGKIRSGDLGRWDMYYFLLQAGFGPPEDAATVVGLSIQEIRRVEHEEEDRLLGLDFELGF
jgi:hypothetical protein